VFLNVYMGQAPHHAGVLHAGSRQAGQRERRNPSADARLGDQVTADPDDGDVGDTMSSYTVPQRSKDSRPTCAL
jgi:hypothetical protein